MDICQSSKDSKVFNDPIHGHMEFHPLCIKIIDTPKFQRLRYIKHLGGCYFVFPGASHNRFEHSLGVCHLAGRLVRQLKIRQPDLNISDEDILCVEIAGLCHALGQGPFSHVFYKQFLLALKKDNLELQLELTSVKMFEHLLQENELRKEFAEFHLNEQDIEFIKEQIEGTKKRTSLMEESNDNDKIKETTNYSSREKKKSFLYEIVANRRNGIDVTRWDYFARDCYGLNIKSVFDHNRFMKFALVLPDEFGGMQICSRDKEAGNLYDMFYIRNVLHRRAYQHKTTRIVEYMLTEALLRANNYIQFSGKDGKTMYNIGDAIEDMEAFTKLNDYIFYDILSSTDTNLKYAQDILKRILGRKLYKFIGQATPNDEMTEENVAKEISNISNDLSRSCEVLKEEDIVVQIVTFDYGKGASNPIDHVRFYRKNDDPQKAIHIDKNQVSQMLPEKFLERVLRVYCKRSDQESVKLAWDAFEKFRKNKCSPASSVQLITGPASLDEQTVDSASATFEHSPHVHRVYNRED